MSDQTSTPQAVMGDSPWGPVLGCPCGRVAPKNLPVPHAPECPNAKA